MNKIIEKNEKTALNTIQKVAKSSEDFEKKLKSALDAGVKANEEIMKANRVATEEYEKTLENLQISQNKLDSLKEDYEKKFRDIEYDLSMRVKEHEDTVFAELIKSRGVEVYEKGTISKLEKQIESLKKDLEAANESNEAEINKAIQETTKTVTERKDLEHKAATAEKDASIISYNKEIESLNNQIKSLQEMISSEREARVEEAKARSGEKITVNNAK